MTAGRRRAILLSAFVMHPTMTSEPGVGWRFLLAAARVAEAHGLIVVAVTNRRSGDACRHAVPESLRHVVDIRVVDLPHEFEFFRWHHPRFTRLEHEWWVRSARRHVRAVAAQSDVVYAHHVTFASDLLATPITSLDQSTFRVWGPVGVGGTASGFLVQPRAPELWFHAAAQVIRSALAGLVSRRVTRRCDLVLAQSAAFAHQMERRDVDTALFPNLAAVEPSRSVVARPRSGSGGLRLLFVGHVIARKRPDLAVAVLSDPRLSTASLTVVGNIETPFYNRVTRLADTLGVADRVALLGPTDPAGVRRAMDDADVLVHLSAREGAPAVVAEAAAAGLPVVCFAGTGGASVLEFCGGPGAAVTPSSRMPIASLADSVIAAAAKPVTSAALLRSDRFEQLAAGLLERSRAGSGRP